MEKKNIIFRVDGFWPDVLYTSKIYPADESQVG